MRYQYVVILKKNSERATDILSVLLCLFSGLTFIYQSFRTGKLSFLPLLIGALLLLGLAVTLLITRRRPGAKLRYYYWLLLAGIGWIVLTAIPWVGVIFFLLAFLEYQSRRPLEVGFDHDHVVINTLVKQRHPWSDFNNIVLKDGLLTLDFKSNRLLQKEVADDDEEDDADEEEFNAYCRSRLAAALTPQ